MANAIESASGSRNRPGVVERCVMAVPEREKRNCWANRNAHPFRGEHSHHHLSIQVPCFSRVDVHGRIRFDGIAATRNLFVIG